MTNSKGWISLHRSIKDHPLWQNEPFTKGQAWVDLLLCANHKPAKIILKNTIIELDRGQQARSQLTLSKEWKWSINKVKRFLKLLESDGMLNIQTNQQTTIISICNYSSFQDLSTTDESTDEEAGEKQTRNKRTTNNNDNKNNNDNNIPYQLFVDVYNENFSELTGCSKVDRLNDKRKRAIKKAWKFETKHEGEEVRKNTNNLDYWKRYFEYCAGVEFFKPNPEKKGDHANWSANFDFLIREDTYTKIIEGDYQ